MYFFMCFEFYLSSVQYIYDCCIDTIAGKLFWFLSTKSTVSCTKRLMLLFDPCKRCIVAFIFFSAAAIKQNLISKSISFGYLHTITINKDYGVNAEDNFVQRSQTRRREERRSIQFGCYSLLFYFFTISIWKCKFTTDAAFPLQDNNKKADVHMYHSINIPTEKSATCGNSHSE